MFRGSVALSPYARAVQLYVWLGGILSLWGAMVVRKQLYKDPEDNGDNFTEQETALWFLCHAMSTRPGGALNEPVQFRETDLQDQGDDEVITIAHGSSAPLGSARMPFYTRGLELESLG